MGKKLFIILGVLALLYILNCSNTSEYMADIDTPDNYITSFNKDADLKKMNIYSLYEYVNKVIPYSLSKLNTLDKEYIKELESAFFSHKYPLADISGGPIDNSRIAKEPLFLARIRPVIDEINRTTKLNFKFMEVYEYKEKIVRNIKTYTTIINIHDGNIRVSKNIRIFGTADKILYVFEVGNKGQSEELAPVQTDERLSIFDASNIEKVDNRFLDHDYYKLPYDSKVKIDNYNIQRLNEVDKNATNVDNKKLVFV
jgi:hypothetical protein